MQPIKKMTKGTLALKFEKKIAFHCETLSVFRILFMFLQTFHVNRSPEQNLRWSCVIYCHALNILYFFSPLILFFSEVLGNIEITVNWLLLCILGKVAGLAESEKATECKGEDQEWGERKVKFCWFDGCRLNDLPSGPKNRSAYR